MKIAAPFDKVKEVRPLIEAGADELYCSVFQPRWFSISGVPTPRPKSTCSLRSFKELKAAVRIAQELNTAVYITLNSYYHSRDALNLIRKDFKNALAAGVTGFIVSDIPLLKEIKKSAPDKPVVLSTMGNCFNTETAAFFKELGAGRIVFPRDLSLSELEYLCAEQKRKGLALQLESFVLNLRCRNVNGFCRCHGYPSISKSAGEPLLSRFFQASTGLLAGRAPGMFTNACLYLLKRTRNIYRKPTPCLMDYKATYISRSDNTRETIPRFYLGEPYDNICAACSIFYFREFGIEYLKIIGKGRPTESKIQDVKFIAALRGALNGHQDFDEFLKKGQELYRQAYGAPCRQAQCHYPCFVKKRTEAEKNAE